MIFGILGPNELSVIERCPYYRGVRKERLDSTSLDLNICIEKVDAKYWLAEITLVMTSLPLARVFQCLFTFALVSAWRVIHKNLTSQSTGSYERIGVEYKFQSRLSFRFPPRHQSATESLLVGYDYTD